MVVVWAGMLLAGICGQTAAVVSVLAAHGSPLPGPDRAALLREAAAGHEARVDRILSRFALLEVRINPESRVKVARGSARAELTAGRESVALVRVVNEGGVTAPLRLSGPNLILDGGESRSAAPVSVRKRYASAQPANAARTSDGPPAAEGDRAAGPRGRDSRWLRAQLVPVGGGATLSGARLEYVAIVLRAEATGYREAVLAFDAGQGTQDLGFRGECPVLFRCRRAGAKRCGPGARRRGPATATRPPPPLHGWCTASPIASGRRRSNRAYRADGRWFDAPGG
ncbi:MAG TPA: hypothetical protein VKT77_16435 [Chthonomonadaceae bacterium]|nr:hypothetical protein [Chthonomonadaceae bacterium]